jgi:hypothetical protein
MIRNQKKNNTENTRRNAAQRVHGPLSARRPSTSVGLMG